MCADRRLQILSNSAEQINGEGPHESLREASYTSLTASIPEKTLLSCLIPSTYSVMKIVESSLSSREMSDPVLTPSSATMVETSRRKPTRFTPLT